MEGEFYAVVNSGLSGCPEGKTGPRCKVLRAVTFVENSPPKDGTLAPQGTPTISYFSPVLEGELVTGD